MKVRGGERQRFKEVVFTPEIVCSEPFDELRANG